MGLGLEVFDANGNIQVNLSTRLMKICGEILTSSYPKRIVEPAFEIANPWYMVSPTEEEEISFLYTDPGEFFPKITINGSVLSWVNGPKQQLDYLITYGIY